MYNLAGSRPVPPHLQHREAARALRGEAAGQGVHDLSDTSVTCITRSC